MPTNDELAKGMNEYAKAIQNHAEILQGNFEDVNTNTLYAATLLKHEAEALEQAVKYAGDFDKGEESWLGPQELSALQTSDKHGKQNR